jgi:hypothetical protein
LHVGKGVFGVRELKDLALGLEDAAVGGRPDACARELPVKVAEALALRDEVEAR